MSIVTGSGDDGHTSLFTGKRVPKHHPRLEAYGMVDEAQSALGMVRASGDIPDEIDAILAQLQRELFTVGSDLATPDQKTVVPRVTSAMVKSLEAECEKLESELPKITSFILPSGSPAAATCFMARAIVRRAERNVAGLLEGNRDVATVLVYLNRLGDLLFLVARALNAAAGIEEDKWRGKEA